MAAIAAVAFAPVSVGGAGTAAAPTVLATFDTPGASTWTVPADVRKVTFDVFGASGGSVIDGNRLISRGGSGGEARGTFTVKPGETFEVVVGGRGGNATGAAGGEGGFNNGGYGGNASFPDFGGAGGGGGSDVRIGGIGNACASNLSCGLETRFVVGGGGGGGSGSGTNGGAGGGLVGSPPEFGGKQEMGPGPVSGTFGRGEDCAPAYPGGGGGGGGWYGGRCNVQTGGGSGFISRFARKGSFPGGTRGGNGLVVITTP